jgi:hypothetical protein
VQHLKDNWLKSGRVASHSGLTGNIHDEGENIEGKGPGFMRPGRQNLHFVRQSPCVDAGTSLHPDAHPVKYQYVKNGKHGARPANRKPDLEPSRSLNDRLAPGSFSEG